MLEKLSKFEQRFREVELLLADTANSDNPKLLAELGKEYSQLESKSIGSCISMSNFLDGWGCRINSRVVGWIFLL